MIFDSPSDTAPAPAAFHLQILPDSRFVLSRENEPWVASFATVKEAMDFAMDMPGSAGAACHVTQGEQFMRVYL